MPVGISDGTSYDDSSEWLANSGDKPYTGGNLGPLQRGPKIDDRRDESFVDKASAYLSQNLSTEKLDFIMSHPNPFDEMSFNAWKEEKNTIAQPPVPDSELGKQLGSDDITMPLGGSTEPAGALKPDGSTNVPEKAPRVELPDISDVPHHDWIESSIKGMFHALTVPGDVASGKIDMNTPEGLSKANELAMTMMGAPAAIVEKAAAKDAILGSFAGVRSATIKDKLADLGHAQVLEGNGVHPDAVTKETGFFRGTDSKWRYEIDDSKASFDRSWTDNAREVGSTGQKVSALPAILDHPELYKAYPKLEETRVRFDPKASTSHADFPNNEIVMAPQHADNQGVLMHEIQHMIQGHEGFAAGGAPGKPGIDFNLKLDKYVQELVPEMQALNAKGVENFTTKDWERALYLKQVAVKYAEYQQAGTQEAYNNYMRLAGEAEARNVDTRLLMTAQERSMLSPRHTEDINPRNQIVVKKPALATAYGVKDPVTGQIMKSEPVPLRSEAQLKALQVEREAYERTLKMSKADRIAAREERYRQLNPPVVQDNKLK